MPEFLILIAILVILVLLLLFRRTIVIEYQAALLYSNGRFVRRLGPGRHWLFRPTQTITRVDLRPRLQSVPGQEVIAADGVSFKLSLACRYHVAQPETAINGVEDYQQALYQVLQLALREIVSGTTGDELLRNRRGVGEQLLALTSKPAGEFGLQIDAVNLKDLTLPGELKKVYSQVALAVKEGQAALERARGETAALRNLANAAKMLEENPALMQLRLIQQLGVSSGNTIVLGVPANSNPFPIAAREPKQPQASPQLPREAGDPP